MKREELLKKFLPLVDFIAAIAGPHCEVVLHDTANVDNSIVAIRNGHVSGRRTGGPLTDLGLKLLQEEAYHTQDILVNYPARTRDGKPLRSSTLFIKDDDGGIAGMLCVNVDLSAALQARKFLDDFLQCAGRGEWEAENSDRACPETMNTSLEELMLTMIGKVAGEINIPPERLSPEEKTCFVRKLNEMGFFLLKGAVAEAAGYLKTSESTIYRYLTKKGELKNERSD
ncbi:helix-turn-helix transcriptional regulator [Desulfotomaculum copahuensis]|uniref:YheO-like PAS domain protein n=1 Tax=Desulfotomaculum copahuensis TaxID=1838280 RepID=A0A1B7LI80_9FIRM|nr:PAS domain-containing protein [Desulfotomaculum copahuensis]OAT86108.1 YheO-like PAS domain protein [Desulfotomaculum copahuensis]